MNGVKTGIGTLLGTGLLPGAPGTWGSLFSLPLIYVSAIYTPPYGIFLFLLIAVILSLWSAPAAVRQYGQDPPQFVMDECAGQTVVFLSTGFLFTPYPDILLLFTGFILFRIFDILKPLGIDSVQKLPGKFGILADDLLAGFYALICLELLKNIPAVLH